MKCQVGRLSPRYLTGLNAYPLPSGLRLAYSQLGTVVELHAARLLRLPLPVVSVEIEN